MTTTEQEYYTIPFYYNPIFLLWIYIFFNHFRPQIISLYKRFDDFFTFIHQNNPLILDYEYKNNTVEEITAFEHNEKKEDQEKFVPKFEDKYLEKFKLFPNEFQPFTNEELEKEKKTFDCLFNGFITFRERSIKDYEADLIEINKIIDIIYSDDTKKSFSQEGVKLLFTYYDLLNEYNNEQLDKNEIEDYVKFIHDKQKDVLKRLEELKNDEILDKKKEEFKIEAQRKKINERLSNYINNYVLEMTPLGNVYMRYNVEKESFEYFSNSTIPYRYLEPIGRKYVMTYWCKPIFVDLEEELKISEEKYDSLKKEKEEKANVIDSTSISNKKSVTAQFKSYNQTKSKKMADNFVPKERGQSGFKLPPQIQANLPDVNQKSEKILLKENANRYTWEGRLGNFSPLKKIDKKIVDKNLNLSWAEYKKLQQENKNN